MVNRVSIDSGQGGGKPTPIVHRRDMDKLYKTLPFFEVGKGSNRGKRQITICRYENELVPRGGPVICSIQGEGTAI